MYIALLSLFWFAFGCLIGYLFCKEERNNAYLEGWKDGISCSKKIFDTKLLRLEEDLGIKEDSE